MKYDKKTPEFRTNQLLIIIATMAIGNSKQLNYWADK